MNQDNEQADVQPKLIKCDECGGEYPTIYSRLYQVDHSDADCYLRQLQAVKEQLAITQVHLVSALRKLGNP